MEQFKPAQSRILNLVSQTQMMNLKLRFKTPNRVCRRDSRSKTIPQSGTKHNNRTAL